MLDVKLIEKDPELAKQQLKNRNMSPDAVDQIISLNQKKSSVLKETEALRNQRNVISKEFGELKKKGGDVSGLTEKIETLKANLSVQEEELAKLEKELVEILLMIPNHLAPEVPVGKDETENKEIRKYGTPKTFDFAPKAHWELGEKLDIIDLARGAKLTGSRFYVLKKYGARLERALINFFLDFYSERGYQEIWPPYMVNSKTMTGTGQLPKFKDDLFKIEGLDYYLIPTAEVPVTNLYADEVLEEENIPQYFCSFTACFRKEAGAYGKDTKGIIRVHQFSKVELVKFVSADKSEEEHEKLLKNVTEALETLGLAYRVILLCSGDTGFSAKKCYDVEVWLPSEKKYREISSVSNFGDFQARRANIKYKTKDKQRAFVHTLNGSGLAVGRTMVAILENYQNADGSITIPEALVPYMNGLKKIGGNS